jgi:hypothetical protein
MLSLLVMYIVYLDEFGHNGPYISRTDSRFKESPVFGFAGIILPAIQVRSFATKFFKLKSKLLSFEIQNSGQPPYLFEKKGSSLYTTGNILRYRPLRQATHRLIHTVHQHGGSLVSFGTEKGIDVEKHNSKALYQGVLRGCISQIDEFFVNRGDQWLCVMDHHQEREMMINQISSVMFGQGPLTARNLIEPPLSVESHRYQTMQFADWICGLVGRIEAYRVRPNEYSDWNWVDDYKFTKHVAECSAVWKLRENFQ